MRQVWGSTICNVKKDEIKGCERTINLDEKVKKILHKIDVHNRKTRSYKITKVSRGNEFCLVAFLPLAIKCLRVFQHLVP